MKNNRHIADKDGNCLFDCGCGHGCCVALISCPVRMAKYCGVKE